MNNCIEVSKNIHVFICMDLCVLEGHARFLIHAVCIYQLLKEAKKHTAEIRRFNVKH